MKLMERRRKTLEKTEASLVGMTVERLSSLNLTSEISTSLLSIPDAYACEKPMEKLKRDGGLDSAPQIPRKRCSGISIPESFPFSDIDNFALSGEFNIEEEDDDEELEIEGPGTDFGFLQDVDPSFAHENATPFTEQDVHNRLKHSAEYMGLVMTDDKFIESREVCWNYFTMCTIWAVTGECEENPAFMLDLCAPACYSCDKIDLDALEYDVEEIEQVA
mmetsp:Transcript_14599/g.19061  ORF Transcript_14599/g.19061 Transcript_14599/m.19061 type:complete len:219 (-) Transcript_14599:124-780(-)